MAALEEAEVSKFLEHNPSYLKRWLVEKSADGFLEDIIAESEKAKPQVVEKPPVSTGRFKVNPNVKLTKKGGWRAIKSCVQTNAFINYLEKLQADRKLISIRDRLASQNLNEKELLVELIRDIASELDVNVLCHKILQNVLYLTQSDRGSLFLSSVGKKGRFLTSKLFDVTETSTLEQNVRNFENEIRIDYGEGIAGYVAQTKETVNIKDTYSDPRFNKTIDEITGYRTRSMLCMPVCNGDGETVGVAQIINKNEGKSTYNKQDEIVFKTYLTFCGIGLTNAQLFEMSIQEFKRNELLLNLAKGLFQEQNSMERLIKMIISDAQNLIMCEQFRVYLLDESSINKEITSADEIKFARVYCLSENGDVDIQSPSSQQLEKSHLAAIAKEVAIVRETVVIDNLKSHFAEPSSDGEGTRNVLCTPIVNQDSNIIAVTIGINKMGNSTFSDNDESKILAFSIFMGLGIHNCEMYETACRLMAKQKVALEVLSFHAAASEVDARLLSAMDHGDSNSLGLLDYAFDDLPLLDDMTTYCALVLFVDCGVIEKFNVDRVVLSRWIMTVKKNYRPVTYHNWRHALNVAQTMFAMFFSGDIAKYCTDLEVFAVLAACLCHDLDHRGTNNAFQVKVETPLAMLYSTSVMEHHHFDHCIMILNSEGSNIFATLSEDQYKEVIETIEHAILSTDLALYFKKRGEFKIAVESDHSHFYSDKSKRELLIAMAMTACDVSAITKPWPIQRSVAELVYGEFFEQGDIEKDQGMSPIAMMDREKIEELPKMQVGFIDAICLPVYQLFAQLSEPLRPLLDGVLVNRNNWQNLSDNYKHMSDQEVKEAQVGMRSEHRSVDKLKLSSNYDVRSKPVRCSDACQYGGCGRTALCSFKICKRCAKKRVRFKEPCCKVVTRVCTIL